MMSALTNGVLFVCCSAEMSIVLNIGRHDLHFASSVLFHEGMSTPMAETMFISRPSCVCVEGGGFTVINRDIKSAHVGKNIEFSEMLQSPQSY